jgi:hypothetical protein
MKYKDAIDIDPDTHELIGTLSTEVDRNAPDNAWNRSLMQRLLHLIHDSSGVEMCNKQDAVIRDPFLGIPLQYYDECDLLRIPDLAVFYAQSIAYLKDANGNIVYDDRGLPTPKALLPLNFDNALIEAVVTDDLLEEESGIEGFRFHPTPAALNRVLLLDPMPPFLQDQMDPAVCRDGDLFIDAHTGTLPVWELNGFYDQMRPIVQAFADHDAEYLFIEILNTFHRHYPSKDSIDHQDINPNGHGYAKRSDIVSYEPMLIDVLENEDLYHAIVDGSPTINSLVAPSGKSAERTLTDAARFIFNPRPGLTHRLGGSTSTTGDGVTVDTISPWYVMADAWAKKRAHVAAAGEEGEAWERATGAAIDLFLRGEDAAGWRFKNPRFRGVSITLIDFLRARVAAHRDAGDLDAWAKQELPGDVERILSGPVFAGAADFVLSLQASPEARAALEDFHVYLTSELSGDEVFQTAITVAADVMQLYQDDPDVVPIARMVGRALDPDFGLMQAHLDFVKQARHADTGGELTRLMRNLLSEPEPGVTALAQIADTICEVNRVSPHGDHGEPMSAEDFRSVFRAVSSFLYDERRSLRSFIEIVANRHVED